MRRARSSDSDADARTAAASSRSLVHHADFRRLWAGDALGQLGAQLSGIALPVLAVERLAATEWEMGVLTAAETAAFLVIGLPAGAWVDRMRKRRVLVTADLARAVVLGAVVAAVVAGVASVPLLVVAALAMSVATVFFDVAHQSYVPGLVGLDHVVEGNSKLQATQSVAGVVAPALGGALLRIVTSPVLLAVTAVVNLVSAALVGRIRQVETLPERPAGSRLRAEIGEGLQFVVREPLLRRIVACTGTSNLASGVSGAVMAIYALRTLDLPTSTWGLVLSASAVGGLVGAVLSARAARWVGEARIIPVAALACVPAAALTPLAALATGRPLVEAGLLVGGGAVFMLAVVVYNVAQVSFRQRLCPPALLGRMNASVRFLVWGTIPIGGLLGGLLGSTVGVVPTLWVSVALTALATLPVVASPLVRLTSLPGPRPSDDAG